MKYYYILPKILNKLNVIHNITKRSITAIINII